MRCPACKPSTEVSRVWLKSDSWFPLGKSWRGRPLTRHTQRMQIRTRGWQAAAARMVESTFLEELRPTLSDAEGAPLRSQGGPLASAPFVRLPMSRFARWKPEVLCVLFLRRLRLPLSLTARPCRCCRPLDWPS